MMKCPACHKIIEPRPVKKVIKEGESTRMRLEQAIDPLKYGNYPLTFRMRLE